jgi:hypothetical protein
MTMVNPLVQREQALQFMYAQYVDLQALGGRWERSQSCTCLVDGIADAIHTIIMYMAII